MTAQNRFSVLSSSDELTMKHIWITSEEFFSPYFVMGQFSHNFLKIYIYCLISGPCPCDQPRASAMNIYTIFLSFLLVSTAHAQFPVPPRVSGAFLFIHFAN